MIKGGLFGKLLKQFFIISLISCFILLGNSFANAGRLQLIGLDSIPSIYDSNYSNSFLKGGGLLSNYLGQGKSILTFNAGAFLWWAKNGQPYFYDHGYQGFFGQYWSCDELTENSTGPSGCSSVPITGDYKDLFKGFFSTVKQGDYAFYDYEQRDIGSSYYDNTVQVCRSSSQIHKSICFRQHECYNGRGCSAGNYGSLTNSQGLTNLNFSLINKNWVGYAPGQVGYDGGQSGELFVPSTGSRLGGRLGVSQGYTNNQMINAYQCIGLIPEMCYGGFPIDDIFDPSESFDDFSGYVAGQGATIFDLYNLYSSSFSNIDQFLSTVLMRYENGQINSFKTEPKALLMLGSQLKVAGFKVSYISTYCNLLLNKNNDDSYTGTSADDLRAQSCLRSQQVNNSLKTSDGSDIVFQGSDVGIFGSGDDVDFDPVTFFSNMFDKFSSNLSDDISGTSVGLVPGYIIAFTLALIFIRMISH